MPYLSFYTLKKNATCFLANYKCKRYCVKKRIVSLIGVLERERANWLSPKLLKIVHY